MRNADLLRDLVGCLEPDAVDVLRQAVGCELDFLNRALPIRLVYGSASFAIQLKREPSPAPPHELLIIQSSISLHVAFTGAVVCCLKVCPVF